MKTTRQKLIIELDRIFGNYIRHRDKGKCFTCGKIWDPTNRVDLNPGHVFSRRHLTTRWDEDNVFAQCRTCNWKQNLEGNGHAVLRVIEMIGRDRVLAVEEKTRRICKLTIDDLSDMIDHYEKKLDAARELCESDGQTDKWVSESPREIK